MRRTAPSAAAGRSRSRLRDGRTAAHLTVAPVLDVFDAKLRVPPPRTGEVSRAGLVNRLRASSARLVTVTAPAGYGKTTLLAQWAERDERPFAWLSLDEHDSDPLILVRHLAAAFDHVEPLDRSLVEALTLPGDDVWTTTAPRLTTTVSGASGPFVFVVDNGDALDSRDGKALLLALLDSVPTGSTLAVASRSGPPLPVGRLRAERELLELETADLALSRRDAELLMRGLVASTDSSLVSDLVASAEGWATGLALNALALDGADDVEPNRYVAQYFESEHLSQLTPDRLAFLRRASVLDELSGPACDAILERTGSADELDALHAANLFLVPLGDGVYRYHSLFAEVLRRDLEHRDPELVALLHARAAAWFEARGELEAALEHAAAAGDSKRAARLLTSVAFRAYDDGRVAEVESWLGRFEAGARLESFPGVAALGGWIHALRGRPETADRWLEAAERGPSRCHLPDGCVSAAPWIAVLRAAMGRDGLERMAKDVQSALRKLPAGSPWLAPALVLRGAVSALAGDPDAATERFAEAARSETAPQWEAVAVAQLSLRATATGDHRAAEELALEALALLAGTGVEDYATSGIVRAAAAQGFLRRGRWDDARHELVRAERAAGFLTAALPWLALETRFALGTAYVMVRDRDGAASQVAEIEAILAARPQGEHPNARLAALRTKIADLPDSRDGSGSGLTGAEIRLLPLLATHLSFREIGERLYVSRNTIKTQAISIYRKLGVSGRSAAVERAAELGLVDEATPVDFMRSG